MHKNSIKSLLFTLCLLLPLSGLFAQSNEEMKKQFQKMGDQFAKAMLEGNNQSMLEFYTDDVISLPSYQPAIRGKNAIREQMKKEENSEMKMTHFKLNTKDVFGSGDLMIEIGTYDLRLILPGMDKEVPDNGKYLNVWEKQSDGSWKLKADIWNTDLNPWQMMGEEGSHHEEEGKGM